MNLKVVDFKGTLADYFKQENDINRLINILSKIDSGEFQVRTYNGIIKEIYGDDKELALIESLAEELLINSTGECNWSNIYKLKESGFNVYAGDEDSFGWLIGCIETKNGIIIYG